MISKVLERCVLSQLREHLKSLVISSQQWFIPSRSCTTQSLEVLHPIRSLLDSGKQTDVIFLDMLRAFDKVSHVALIYKLNQFHISGSLLQWFSSYISMVANNGSLLSVQPLPRNQCVLECYKVASWDQYFSCCISMTYLKR